MAWPLDVEATSGGGWRLQSETAGTGDIVDADEVPLLLAVFEDQRRPVVQNAGREIAEDARVGVRQRLVRPVSVEETEGDRRDLVRRADDHTEALLVVLGKSVDGGQ